MEPYNLWFGKFKDVSLEEVALGKRMGGRVEGYPYFYMLAKGDPQYFGMFQSRENGMKRWNEIYEKLNNFESAYECAVCKNESPVYVSIAGSSHDGYSMSRSYICCDNSECKGTMMGQTNNARLVPLEFDTILKFGKKFDQRQATKLMLELAGWPEKQRLTADNAVKFIESINLRR